jgi:hypothetical protein
MPSGEMEIVEGGTNAGMAQKPLDGMRVTARFEQVRREGVSQRMDPTGLRNPGFGLGALKDAPGGHARDVIGATLVGKEPDRGAVDFPVGAELA